MESCDIPLYYYISTYEEIQKRFHQCTFVVRCNCHQVYIPKTHFDPIHIHFGRSMVFKTFICRYNTVYYKITLFNCLFAMFKDILNSIRSLITKMYFLQFTFYK